MNENFMYPEYYLIQDLPVNPNFTILDLVLFFILSVFLLTAFIYLVKKWMNEDLEK